MPTLFTIFGLRFYFYSEEHLPIHVHVRNPDGRAKIQVDPEVVLIENKGIKPNDLKKALTLANLYKEQITEFWYEFFMEK
ncbi:MAG: DUF4160 domain-containing protein [Bacteroidales bacterium]|nr:DUF4160 domain-containing protein [Bacteroidales bacterium]